MTRRSFSVFHVLLSICVILMVGCAKFWKAVPAAIDTSACAVTHWHEWPWTRLVKECGITPENQQAILDLIEQQKAREAAIRREAGCKW